MENNEIKELFSNSVMIILHLKIISFTVGLFLSRILWVTVESNMTL